jgi:hypothetical protein
MKLLDENVNRSLHEAASSVMVVMNAEQAKF